MERREGSPRGQEGGQEAAGGEAAMPSPAHRVLPYTVRSCLIYFHLRQEPPDVRAWPDQRHHAVAVHGAVALHAAPQAGEDARGAAALAVAAVATVAAAALAGADRDEERVSPALALLHRAVLVVCELVFRAGVPEPPGAPEAEDAAFAVVSGEEGGAWDAEQRLREGGRERREKEKKRSETKQHPTAQRRGLPCPMHPCPMLPRLSSGHTRDARKSCGSLVCYQTSYS